MLKRAELRAMEAAELLALYAELIEELRDRELVRTSNNPVADYAEKVAVERLNLSRAHKEEKGYDATDGKHRRYQVKGRRITRHNRSRQLSVIRNLDERPFDYLVAVVFDESFRVAEMWEIPYEFVKKYSKWSAHQNGHIFHAKPDLLLADKRVRRVA